MTTLTIKSYNRETDALVASIDQTLLTTAEELEDTLRDGGAITVQEAGERHQDRYSVDGEGMFTLYVYEAPTAVSEA